MDRIAPGQVARRTASRGWARWARRSTVVAMANTTSKSIGSLIAEVDSGEILLPEIQRGYVWKPAQIAYLLDSLYRGYPTGSMLLWKPSEDVVVRSLSIAASGKPAAHSPLYLLDGQQRLTSLHRVIKGHPEAEVVFLPGEKPRFQVQSAATKKDPRWIRVKDIFGGASLLALSAGAAAAGGFNQDVVYDLLHRVRQINDRLFYVEIVENLPYSEVAEVFVRVNSRGRPLKTVDLTLAMLSTEWPGVVTKVDEAAALWKSQGWPGIDATFLVRSLAAVVTESGLLTQLPRTAHDNASVMDNAWLDVLFGIDFVVKLLRENLGIATSTLITSMNALVPLVALLSRYREPGQAAFEEADAVAYWLFGVLITGRFSAAADSMIAADAMAVRKSEPVKALYATAGLAGAPLRVTSEQLIGKGASSAFFLLSFLAARKLEAKDWWHDVVVGQQGVGHFALEYHHIHPRATLKEHYSKAEINDLANLAFISAKANKKISDRSPKDYFPEVKSQLAAHLVPLDEQLRTAEHFHDFAQARRTQLATAMTELLDARRPTWVGGMPAQQQESAGERSLAITRVISPDDVMILEARERDHTHTSIVATEDLLRFVSDAENGLAAELVIDTEVAEHAPQADELRLPVGPLWVTRTVPDWRRVMDREEDEAIDGEHEVPAPSPSWTGDRSDFAVLDSD